MRRSIFFVCAVVVSLVALSPLAVAQVDEETFRLDERYERDIVTVEPSITGERIYVVQEGDTLWDICDALFSDPWYWPSLWAYNPQITNPHWIFPGDYVYVRPRQTFGGGQQQIWSGSRYSRAPKDVQLLATRKGFIPVKRYRESGEIVASREEKTLFGEMDEIYIRFSTVKKIRPEQKYTVYRVEKEIEHPVSGETLGYKVHFLGMTNILEADKPLVTGVIIDAHEEIERGDLLTASFEHTSRLGPITNDTDVEGVIAEVFSEETMAGEHHYIFIDKGADAGVKRGNRFIVLWRGDGMDEDLGDDELDEFPWETIGEAMVVESHEGTSLAVLTHSVRELLPGMRVKMVKGY